MGQTLPSVPLPTETIVVAGAEILIRGLSRSEAIRIGGEFAGNLDAAETFVIARGCDISEEDARLWREATPPDVVGEVADRIIVLSGLADTPEGATKSGSAGSDAG